MTGRSILVVGGGPAGTFAAMAAKKQDPAATVTLLTAEACEPYEKPPLSKAFLLGKMVPADAQIAGPAGITSHGVELGCVARVAAVDRAARMVTSSDGRRWSYDTLVLATGAVARELPQLPYGSPRVHYLRHEHEAHGLKEALATCRRLAIVGGGLIGLEVAASAAELGVPTTVLEVEPRILARVCDEETGARVHAAHEARGVSIRLGTGLREVAWTGDTLTIATTTGDTIDCDAVVVGIGSRPDTSLAVAAGLTVNDGIIVDAYCRTSDPAIFAAGDAVRFPGPSGAVRLENWRHALDQGMVAGRNAAGASEQYTSLPSFWSEQYDLYVQGVGWPVAGAIRVHRPMPPNAALSFELDDGRMVYAMGINAQRDISIARRLIERRIAVTPDELADPQVALQPILKRG